MSGAGPELRARYVVKLRGGARVEAADVELLPGWVRATVVRTRVECDDDGHARRVFEGIRRRSYPAGRVLEVVEEAGT